MRCLQLSRTIVVFRDPLLAHLAVRWGVIAAAVFLAGAWIAILAIPNPHAPDALVTHFTTTFGIDALGSWTELLRLPITGAVLLAVNLGLARYLADEKRSQGPSASVSGTIPVRSLPSAATVLVVASVLLEFAVLLGCALLYRENLRR